MSLTEAYRLDAQGKVVAGQTMLRDPQTGQCFDVVSVQSGRMPMPVNGRAGTFRGSSAERCAMYGSRKRWREDA